MYRVSFRTLGDEVAISFPYDDNLVEVARGLSERRFDSDTKEWLVPAHLCREALSAFEAAPCLVYVEPEVESLLQSPPGVPARSVRVYREGEDYVVDFPYDDRIVRAVKTIPGRRFDPGRKLWLVGIVDPVETLRQIVRQLRYAECNVVVDDGLRHHLSR